MKLAILTQPISTNYGGILQAYVLQAFLRDLGHDVVILNFKEKKLNLYDKSVIFFKRFILRYFFGRKNIDFSFESKYEAIKPSLFKETFDFIDKYFTNLSSPIHNRRDLMRIVGHHFDGYIVGSDQVWRPIYSPDIKAFYIDFEHSDAVKRVAYAASFGVDKWEYSFWLTCKVRSLVKKFDCISVRESSGVEICRKRLKVDATQVLDPTMLWSEIKYVREFGLKKSEVNGNFIAAYILDLDDRKSCLIREVANHLALGVTNLYKNGYQALQESFSNPSPVCWLETIYNASFVVTDSFHGCVFAILFKKQFVVLGNSRRGTARFVSLLEQFDLLDRFVGDESFMRNVLMKNIDYDRVHLLLEEKRIQSIGFLKESLA